MFELGMGAIHMEDQEPFDGNGSFRELGSPENKQRYALADQHLKDRRERTQRGRLSLSDSELQNGAGWGRS